MEPYEASDTTSRQLLASQRPAASDEDHEGSQTPGNLDNHDSLGPLTNILNELVQLKYFLLTGPAQLRTQDGIHRHTLPNKDQISCVVWKNVYFITGTDIVRCLSFRIEAFGREISNRKKFEEGIFSDLRNLKCDTDAVLEQPKSEFLDFLYRNNCVRTQKKQKIFYWFSVNHDRLFQDALERDLKKELTGKKSSTTPVRDPAISFQYDGSRTLHDQLPDIIEKFPRPLAELTDASSIMSNLPISSAHMIPPHFAPTVPYSMMSQVPVLMNQPQVLQSNGMPFYSTMNPEMGLTSEGMVLPMQPPGQFLMPYQLQTQLQTQLQSNQPSLISSVTPPPLSASAPPHVPSSVVFAESTASSAHATPGAQSDFPLDYVEPTTDASEPSQQYFKQPAAMAQMPQGYYYKDQFQQGFSGVSSQDSLTAYSDTQAYKTALEEPAITYDNQQFQVVYHQDENGAFTSSMISTTSASRTPPTLESRTTNKESGSSLPRDQQIKTPTLQRSVPNQRMYQTTPPQQPHKKHVIKEGLIPRPSSATLAGSSSRMPAALQAKKLHSKIVKPANPVRVQRQPAAGPSQAYERVSASDSSSVYFIPTPSESGCSDLTTFAADPDFGDYHSPALFAGNGRPSSRGSDGQHLDLRGSSGLQVPGFKVGAKPSAMMLRPTQASDISRRGVSTETFNKRKSVTYDSSPGQSEYDEVAGTGEDGFIPLTETDVEDGRYMYGEGYGSSGRVDWV